MPGVTARQHGETVYDSIFRFDDALLANAHTFGAAAAAWSSQSSSPSAHSIAAALRVDIPNVDLRKLATVSGNFYGSPRHTGASRSLRDEEGRAVALPLKDYTRHKCFISYHHDDETEVQAFIEEFDHDGDVLISRGIGASMPGDVIDSNNDDYIKSRIRSLYLGDSTVTIVMLGRCTWSRRFVDWEVAGSLRNTATSNRNGLMAITLPSVADLDGRRLPARVDDNVNGEVGFARWWKYPTSTSGLASMIDGAFEARTEKADFVVNSRGLLGSNQFCL